MIGKQLSYTNETKANRELCWFSADMNSEDESDFVATKLCWMIPFCFAGTIEWNGHLSVETPSNH